MNALVCSLVILAHAADGPNLPRFSKKDTYKSDEAFFAELGEAIVKAARTNPTKLKLASLKITDLPGKPGRKTVRIEMVWRGAITGRKVVSRIELDCDATNKARWELLTIAYWDDGAGRRPTVERKLLPLVRQFNR